MKQFKTEPGRFSASFKTRTFRMGGYSVASAALVIAIAVVVNLLASALPSSWTQFDTTSNQMFTMSQQTEELVSGLDREVTVYWIVRNSYEDPYIKTLLDTYTDLSGKVKVVKKDPELYPTFTQQYTDSVTENSLIVVSEDRYRYVDFNDIYVLDYYNYYYYGTEDWTFYGESELTSAIDFVISEELPKIYTLTGHGETALSDTFATAVDDENIEMADLSLLTVEAVPEDADCILIISPQSDISEEEKAKLELYLASGGNLILLSDPLEDGSRLTNLEAVMAAYGVTATDGIVVEADQNHYAWGTPYYLLPDLATHTITSPLTNGGYRVMLPISQGLTVSSTLPDGVSVTELLTTSDTAYSKVAGYDLTTYDQETGDIKGPFALAVAITKTVDDDTSSNLVWVSSSVLLDEQINSRVSGGNQDFFLNVVNYLCEPEGSSISIHAKSLSDEYLTMDSGTVSMLTMLIVVVIPLGYLSAGIYVWARRRRK